MYFFPSADRYRAVMSDCTSTYSMCVHVYCTICVYDLSRTLSDIQQEADRGVFAALLSRVCDAPRSSSHCLVWAVLLSGGSYSRHEAWRGPTAHCSNGTPRSVSSQFLHGLAGARQQPNNFFYAFHTRKAERWWRRRCSHSRRPTLIRCSLRCCLNSLTGSCLEKKKSLKKGLHYVRNKTGVIVCWCHDGSFLFLWILKLHNRDLHTHTHCNTHAQSHVCTAQQWIFGEVWGQNWQGPLTQPALWASS